VFRCPEQKFDPEVRQEVLGGGSVTSPGSPRWQAGFCIDDNENMCIAYSEQDHHNVIDTDGGVHKYDMGI
jgi:hypothetical protein